MFRIGTGSRTSWTLDLYPPLALYWLLHRCVFVVFGFFVIRLKS